MATVSAGATGTATFTGASTVAITLGAAERATVRVVTGSTSVYSDNLQTSREIGPFSRGAVMSLTAIGGAVDYTVIQAASPVSGPRVVLVDGDLTITAATAGIYDGATLEWTTAAVVTLSASLPANFGFAGVPPASGNASIASAGGTLLNGATTTLTRAAASNAMFAVVARASAADSYVVTGS